MVRRSYLLLSVIFTLSSLYSDVGIDAKLTGAITAGKVDNSNITSSGRAGGSLTVKSEGIGDVKSQLTLDFLYVRNLGMVSIEKAWIKFRYPLLRVTLGKNRITWGEGQAFNAGDVIFDDYISPDSGSLEEADLTADELKSLNRTLAQVIFPLGMFSYAEAIYLPYDFFSQAELGSAATGEYPEDKGFSEHSYGGRLVTKAGGVKLESGYIYNGYRDLHKPYISINGTIILDYQLSASVNIPQDDGGFNSWKESFKVSGGLFYLFELENNRTLTLRIESLIKPFSSWEGDAIRLYPEIVYIPDINWSFFLRSLINPLEENSTGTFGINWKTYEGFTIGSYLSAGIDRDNASMTYTMSVTHLF